MCPRDLHLARCVTLCLLRTSTQLHQTAMLKAAVGESPHARDVIDLLDDSQLSVEGQSHAVRSCQLCTLISQRLRYVDSVLLCACGHCRTAELAMDGPRLAASKSPSVIVIPPTASAPAAASRRDSATAAQYSVRVPMQCCAYGLLVV